MKAPLSVLISPKFGAIILTEPPAFAIAFLIVLSDLSFTPSVQRKATYLVAMVFVSVGFA